MQTALLLIDLQNDYLGSPGLEPGVGALCAAAAQLLDACRSTEVPVVHIWTTIRTDDGRMPHWRATGLQRCLEGTPGHSTPLALQPRHDEFIVHKQYYSGFANAGLEAHLRRLHVDTLILAGVHLRACVRTTAIDAYQHRFSVWIAEDAVADDDPVHATITRQYLADRFVQFLPVDQICRLIAPTGMPEAPCANESAPALPALVVAGKVRPADSLRRIAQVSPRDGRTRLFEVAVCGREQIAEAAEDARRTLHDWSKVHDTDRRELLLNLASCIESHAEEFARKMAVEIGKPLRDARQEVTFAIDLVRAAVSGAGGCPSGLSGAGWQARRRPVGVVAVVTPWNNPLAIALGKIAPAILYGNAVVWKPALPGAGVATAALTLLHQAGLPPGLVNLVHGDRSTSEQLMCNGNIDAVTLTGSCRAGYSAQVICSRRRLPFQAELGGNNAAIIWSDTDLEQAATLVAQGAFGSAGQRCTATRRLIVDRNCYTTFLDELQAAAARLRWGDPLDELTHVGPVISAAALRRIVGIVDRARAAGATVVTPHCLSLEKGHRMEGFYCPPTIICGNAAAAEVVLEETFGPVVAVQEAASWEQALELCNGVEQGLVAALFSNSREHKQLFVAGARAGMLKINTATAGAAADAPFCGWKTSAVGPPEHGICDAEFYTRWQTVYTKPSRVSE